MQLLVIAGTLLACRLELFAHGRHLLVRLCEFGAGHVGREFYSVRLVSMCVCDFAQQCRRVEWDAHVE